ncbi:MAG: hypothetical protein ACKOVA_17810, partial [Novosphingobium sp.]
FDLRQDPEEIRNLAGDPEYAHILADFKTRLRSLLDPEGVNRQAKADQQKLVDAFGGRDVALRTGTPAATPVPRK